MRSIWWNAWDPLTRDSSTCSMLRLTQGPTDLNALHAARQRSVALCASEKSNRIGVAPSMLELLDTKGIPYTIHLHAEAGGDSGRAGQRWAGAAITRPEWSGHCSPLARLR